ncbi:hypothetical protein Acsp06_16630 [Actinomycetospora sp. NBRC 106375]|uniref:hypothetical protein n=1 Tax=Actinomycetospora sp. NBRC 106375 TaxID=3032207 RepID=UPI0024A1E02C|nr:hypothetical protein [Actinomycetospora sp. NBRC 106375]GLZ45478.1 hypothetical protein Acsp06_16630 [Actinomycetospora sp. NBRC 106375]
MNCLRCRRLTSAELDAEATTDELAEARAHLADCAACREHRERSAAVSRLARAAATEPAPDLVDAILDRVLPVRAGCGCPSTCGCGCQAGRPCQCSPQVA